MSSSRAEGLNPLVPFLPFLKTCTISCQRIVNVMYNRAEGQPADSSWAAVEPDVCYWCVCECVCLGMGLHIHTQISIYGLSYSLHAAQSLLEKLTVSQLVKKFPAFYRTGRFITAFTSARHVFLSWASSIQPIPPHSASYYPPIYAWIFQVVSLPEVSPSKPCIRLSPPPYALHAPPISFFSIWSPEQYWVSGTDQ